MAERRPTITQAVIARAVKAAKSAGLTVGRIEVEGERVTVYSADAARTEPTTILDGWLDKKNARSA